MKIKNPFTRNNVASNSGYSKELKELQDALQGVLALHVEEKSNAQLEKEALNASREKQALLLERVASLATCAASTARNESTQDVAVPEGMQVYHNENLPPKDPAEEGFEFFKISFKQESRAVMISELHREGQLSMGIYPIEVDRRTFKAMFTRMDGLPINGEYSWVSGLLFAVPGSWTWDIAEGMRRASGGGSKPRLTSMNIHKIYRRGATIFIGVKPNKE